MSQGKILRSKRLIRVSVGPDFEECLARQTTVPGVAVHEEMYAPTWTVTHIASGYSIVPSDSKPYSLEEVRRIVAALPALGIDWTAPAEVVGTKSNGKRIRELVEKVRRRVKP